VNQRTKEEGFTTTELLVSIVITSIIMLSVYSVYRVQTHSTKVQENRLEAQEYARATLDIVVREVRNAGYAPTGATCAGVAIAESQRVQIRYDANADGDCGDTDEDVTYNFETTGCAAGYGNVTRKEGSNASQALTDCNVQTGASNFSFTYYAQNCTNNFSTPVGGGSSSCPGSPGGNAGTLAAIQRIAVSLTVQSKNPDTAFGGQLNATMTSNVDLRNRGLPS
jgi:Tfp pilus assembly protein PilW